MDVRPALAGDAARLERYVSLLRVVVRAWANETREAREPGTYCLVTTALVHIAGELVAHGFTPADDTERGIMIEHLQYYLARAARPQ